MSVTFHVRSVGERLLEALRQRPTLTASLCDQTLDFDADAYERDFVERTRPDLLVERRPSHERRLAMLVTAKQEALAPLLEVGLSLAELGEALHLGRSWWGMQQMIASPAGNRLVNEHEGDEVGEDVGYGPAHLLLAAELPAISVALATVTREDAEPRFREHLAADMARRAAAGLGLPPAMTDAQFVEWSWDPLVRLRTFVARAVDDGVALLRWYD